jgi:hypothetical protein
MCYTTRAGKSKKSDTIAPQWELRPVLARRDPHWLPGYVDPEDAEALEQMEKELGVVLCDLSPPSLDVAQLLRDKNDLLLEN